jgi:hypothetical protein
VKEERNKRRYNMKREKGMKKGIEKGKLYSRIIITKKKNI